MSKRIHYIILLVLLLSGAQKALAQIAMPDNVCVGTIRHYWVNGTAGSTYTWKINGVIQASTADNIDITWSTTGNYTITVQEHQNSCDGDVQSGQVIVGDLIKPSFTLPTLAAGYCVENIYEAVYNDGFEETPTDLTYLRPDYYLFEQGSKILNLPSYSDNCTLAANPISWIIEFADGTSLSGTGQLENYIPPPPTVPPDRPVAGIHFPVGTNKITFKVTDAMGNFQEQTILLEVIPRPTIITNF
jgi:hypothetical protein